MYINMRVYFLIYAKNIKIYGEKMDVAHSTSFIQKLQSPNDYRQKTFYER